MKLSQKTKAILALVAVALSYALLNISIRLMGLGFGPFTQVYLRIGGGFLLTLLLFQKHISFETMKKYKRKDWIILLFMGSVGYGLTSVFVSLGALHTTLLNVAVIGSISPFFSFILSFLLFRKRPKLLMIVFLIVSFFGVCVMATRSYLPVLSHFGTGELYVLVFAFGVGLYSVLRKLLSQHITNSEISIIVLCIATLSAFLGSLVMGETMKLSSFSNPLVLLGFAIGAVLNVVVAKLINYGLSHLNAVVGTQLLLVENIFSPLVGFLFYHEIIVPVEFVGALLVILGVFGSNSTSLQQDS